MTILILQRREPRLREVKLFFRGLVGGRDRNETGSWFSVLPTTRCGWSMLCPHLGTGIQGQPRGVLLVLQNLFGCLLGLSSLQDS